MLAVTGNGFAPGQYRQGSYRHKKTQVSWAWQLTVGVAGNQLTILAGGFVSWVRLLGTTCEHLFLGKFLCKECKTDLGISRKASQPLNIGGCVWNNAGGGGNHKNNF